MDLAFPRRPSKAVSPRRLCGKLLWQRPTDRSYRAELFHGRLPAIAKPVHHWVLVGQRLGYKHRGIDNAIRQDIRASMNGVRDSLQRLRPALARRLLDLSCMLRGG